MGVSSTVEVRCGVAEIVAAYRRERDAVRRSHVRVIWLLLEGMATAEFSRVTGFGVRRIEKPIQRWNVSPGLAIGGAATPGGSRCWTRRAGRR